MKPEELEEPSGDTPDEVTTDNGRPQPPRHALRRRLVLRGGRAVEVSGAPLQETR